ncbi:HelD family protein [Labedaea rhizosphaerae]|uniref:HelD family protein n=1 Tax=Labedaea rhizosphaerae TaxID=598644 RepID=UPI001FB7ABFE|nr:ATP-binding domain-containing protein [Labedaea rhizosphaerae]
MSSTEIDNEQQYVATLYDQLDALRAQAADRLAVAVEPDVKAFWQGESARLAAVEDGLCFGRLDLVDGRRAYIGRLGLFRDEDDEPLLVDWRAPAARPYYVATAAEPGGVRRRRRITTRGRTVVALDDELLDGDAGDPGDLVGEAALLAELGAERTGRMHDIVTTLQAEQDRVVRDDHPGVLVVQGGPGTGKTAVALHRLACLLYTRTQLRGRGVLVVGPSTIFLDYIGQVLPGLGENSVVTTTIAGMRPDAVITRAGTTETVTPEQVAAAVRARVRRRELEVEFEEQRLVVDPGAAITAARAAGLPHNAARLVFQRHVLDALARELADRMERVVLTESGEALDGGSTDGTLGAADLRALEAAGVIIDPDQPQAPRTVLDEADKASLRDALLADPGVTDALDEVWPHLRAEDVAAEVLGWPDGWSEADVPVLDEAAAVLGDGGFPTYGHVVVDEAQELSPMAWRMLMRRCPTRSMTIVGDLAQTSTTAGTTSWADVLGPHVEDRWRLAQLTVNYRTPTEVMAAAAKLFAAHHPGLTPARSVRSTGHQPWRLEGPLPSSIVAAVAEHTTGRLAVITPRAHHATLVAALGVAAEPDLTAPVVVLTPAQAKGLEFDVVLIADPARILTENPLGHNDLYVAMTRATQRLGIVHPGPVPDVLADVRQRES